MTKEEKETRITLELIIRRKSSIKIEGNCYKETPEMNTKVNWYHLNAHTPKRSINSKKFLINNEKFLRQATLLRKYSQLISFANEYYPRKDYQIRVNIRRTI